MEFVAINYEFQCLDFLSSGLAKLGKTVGDFALNGDNHVCSRDNRIGDFHLDLRFRIGFGHHPISNIFGIRSKFSLDNLHREEVHRLLFRSIFQTRSEISLRLEFRFACAFFVGSYPEPFFGLKLL